MCIIAREPPRDRLPLTIVVGAGTWPGDVALVVVSPAPRLAMSLLHTTAQLSLRRSGFVGFGFRRVRRSCTGWHNGSVVCGVFTITVGLSLLWWICHFCHGDRKGDRGYRGSCSSTIEVSRHTPSPTSRVAAKTLSCATTKVSWTVKDVVEIIATPASAVDRMYFGVGRTGFGLSVFGSLSRS